MSIVVTALQQQRRDTAANWTAQNPTLLAGEIGIESNTDYIKVGDGNLPWTELNYFPGSLLEAYPLGNTDIANNAITSAKILDGTIVNADINASAGIVDTKLATISTAGKVSNSATTADSANTASAIVARDGSGNFSAGTITANLTGTASAIADNTVTSAKIVDGTIVNADVNASAAIAGTKITPDFGSQALTTTGLISANGKVSFPLGTAALPSLYPGTDTNTGIYSPGADQVAISTNGTGRLFVRSDGNIGIGGAGNIARGLLFSKVTTGGTNASAIHAETQFQSDVTGNADVFASVPSIQDNGQTVINLRHFRAFQSTIGATATVTNQYGFSVDSSLTGGTNNFGFHSNIASGTGRWNFYSNGTADSYFASNNFIFANGGTERARIDSSGRLGLGTSSPDALLTVNGVGAFGAGAVTTPSIAATGDLNTGFWFPAADTLAASTAGGERLRITSAGLVGIGTSDPGTVGRSAYRNLVISGTGNRGLTINSGSGSAGGLVFNDTNGGFQGGISYLHADDSMQFQVNNSERARIDSSGRLLVGTSTALSARALNLTIDAAQQLAGVTTIGATSAIFRYSANDGPPLFSFNKSRNASVGLHTIVQDGDQTGLIGFAGSDGSAFVESARITAVVDGTPGANDMPGRLVFSTTADGAASPTERLRITSAGVLQVADAGNITVGTTTGTKIGTATTQKIGFYNSTPVVQPAAVADATTAVDVITQLNDLLAKLRTLGIIAT
jgi:hypothetical protein